MSGGADGTDIDTWLRDAGEEECHIRIMWWWNFDPHGVLDSSRVGRIPAVKELLTATVQETRPHRASVMVNHTVVTESTMSTNLVHMLHGCVAVAMHYVCPTRWSMVRIKIAGGHRNDIQVVHVEAWCERCTRDNLLLREQCNLSALNHGGQLFNHVLLEVLGFFGTGGRHDNPVNANA